MASVTHCHSDRQPVLTQCVLHAQCHGSACAFRWKCAALHTKGACVKRRSQSHTCTRQRLSHEHPDKSTNTNRHTNLNKLKVIQTSNKSAFYFKNNVCCYIKYDRDLFQSFKRKSITCFRQGSNSNSVPHIEIPIHLLVDI